MQDVKITASEAIYGFTSWLTTRDGTLMVGAKNDISPLVGLISEWCNANNIIMPREGVYPNNIIQPEHSYKVEKEQKQEQAKRIDVLSPMEYIEI